MRAPVIKAASAENNTAAADTSFMNFILESISFDAKSANFSIAVLKNSAAQTKPTTTVIAMISVLLT
jgi:hypothetical protein